MSSRHTIEMGGFFSARFSSILCVLFCFSTYHYTVRMLDVQRFNKTSVRFCISFVCFQIILFVVRCRFGSRIVAPNGGVKRNRKVCVLVCHIFHNCRIGWHAMVAVCRWIRGYHRPFYPHCQVNDCHSFAALTFAPKCSSIIFQSLAIRFSVASAKRLPELFNATTKFGPIKYGNVQPGLVAPRERI